MKNRMRRNYRNRQQRGFVLIATMVCLGVIVAMLLLAFQTSLKQTRRLNRELQMEQTRWLARAVQSRADELLNGEENRTLRLKLQRYPDTEVTIKKSASDVTVNARIGLKDRPELQTRRIISTQLSNSTSEKSPEGQP